MMSLKDSLIQRVQKIVPGLDIESFELNQDGLINDVVIINKALVFRFTKKQAYNTILKTEMDILDLIRDRVGVEVPNPLKRLRDCVVYPYLQGQPLLREYILALDDTIQNDVAEQLGHFLYSLHTTPVNNSNSLQVPPTTAPGSRDVWLAKYQKVKEKVYPLLLPHQIQWSENLFRNAFDQPNFFDFETALIHGDLAPYHILFNSQTNTVSGVIDFGVAGIGDAAIDIGILMTSYGESFIMKSKKTYPRLEELLPRARFRASAIEFEWVLNGLESGENFWFTAHIGGARDIG